MIAICMLMLLIYIDFKSRPSALRPIRMVAIVAGLASLLALYLEPSIRKQAPKVKLVIETSGNAETVLDSLKQSGYLIVRNVSEYVETKASAEITKLVVVGDGFERWEVDEIAQPYQYIPSSSKLEGPFELEVEEAVVSSSTQIAFRLMITDSIQLSLSGPGIQEVSKSIGKTDDRILFSVTPSISGHLKYQLDGVRNGDTIFTEVVPVRVVERSKTAILMLGGAPSFEYRFLKNYLAEEGFGVAERIQISTDVYRDSFTNLKRRSLSSLTSEKLTDFQLVVLDASSYNMLGRGEMNRLKEKLKKGELGLIWTANDVANDLVRTERSVEERVEFTKGLNVVDLGTNTERLLGSNGVISFQNKEVGEVLEVGLGKIILPRVISSYSLILKGEEELYAQLWQRLLQPAIGADWNVNPVGTPSFPRVGEPMNLAFANGEGDESMVIDSTRLAKEERWYQLGKWESTYWPKKKGWNSLDGTSTKFFVFDSTDWPNQKKITKQTRTEMYGRTITSQSTEIKQIDQPISKWIFFITFVISFGFLWLEQRIR